MVSIPLALLCPELYQQLKALACSDSSAAFCALCLWHLHARLELLLLHSCLEVLVDAAVSALHQGVRAVVLDASLHLQLALLAIWSCHLPAAVLKQHSTVH
jgi:hypothetical protein